MCDIAGITVELQQMWSPRADDNQPAPEVTQSERPENVPSMQRAAAADADSNFFNAQLEQEAHFFYYMDQMLDPMQRTVRDPRDRDAKKSRANRWSRSVGVGGGQMQVETDAEQDLVIVDWEEAGGDVWLNVNALFVYHKRRQ